MRYALRDVGPVIGVLLCASAGGQIPEGYEVVMLANDPGIHSRPEINDRSEVVWSSSYPPPIGRSDVWLYGDGVIRKISDDDGYDVFPTINDDTLVPWLRCESYFDTECDLAVYQDGLISMVPTPVSVDQTVGLSNGGVMVWPHDFSGTFDHVELFRTTDGATEQLTSSGLANQTPRTNSQSDVAWIEYDFSSSPWRSRVMLWLAEDADAVALTDGTGQPQRVDINDLRQVAWGELDGTVHMIKVWEAGKAETITEGVAPRINNTGAIAYARWDFELSDWEPMLYTDGSIYQLPDQGTWGALVDINDRDEVCWQGIVNEAGDTAIFVLRRIGPKGDFDHDCHVDFYDIALFQRCFTGANSGPPGGLLGDCDRGDFDDDGDVDLADYEELLSAQTGPGLTVPGCAP